MKHIRSIWALVKGTFSEFSNDKVMKLSAALAYYTIFSIAPMLLIVISISSLFFGKEAVQGKVFHEIAGFIGTAPALQIQEILRKTTLHNDNVLVTIIGVATLFVGATGIFGEVQDSINQIWGLKTKPRKGFVRIVINRLLSFSMILVLGFILLVSLVINALLAGLFERLKLSFSMGAVNLALAADYLLMFAVITLLFGCIFKVLPDARIRWRDVLMGSLVTALLFMIGKFVIGYYMQHNSAISAYGAAGSVIVILLWVYYSAIILYIGAEFTKVYVKMKGRYIEPNRYAVWVETSLVQKASNQEVDSSKKQELDPSKKAER